MSNSVSAGEWGPVRTRLLQALIVLLPIHALGLQIGFSLKPWFLPLCALLAVDAANVIRRMCALPRLVMAGWALTLVGGLLGAAFGPDPVVAGRHLIALGIVFAAMLVWPDPRRVPSAAVGDALRIAAALVGVSAVVESALLLSGTALRPLLLGMPGTIEPIASVIYGDMLVPHGLHVDSNFLALYAIVIAFLLPVFRTPRWPVWVDGALGGLLALAPVVAFSRSGVLAFGTGGLVLAVARRDDLGRALRPLAVAALTIVVGFTGLVVADTLDGLVQIEYFVWKRFVQTVDESTGLFAGLTDEEASVEVFNTDLDEYVEWSPPRSELWAAHIEAAMRQPLTGIGFGVGRDQFVDYAHNAPIEAFAGGGVTAVGGLLLMWGGAMGRAGWSGGLRHAALRSAALAYLVLAMFLSTNYSPLGGILLGMLVQTAPWLRDGPDDRAGRRADGRTTPVAASDRSPPVATERLRPT